MSSVSAPRTSPTMIRVGPHAERVAYELADLDLACAFDVRRARLERDHVVLLELELGGVLDRDDALVGRDERAHRVERCRLAGAGTAGDEDVELALHARGEELRRPGAERAERDQVVDRVRVTRELPDRHRRAVQRERWDDRVDTAAIGEARIDHRRGLVDAASDLRDDLVDDPHDVRLVDEANVAQLELAVALDVDAVVGVDHDLGDRVVAKQRLDRAVAEDVVGQLADDLAPLLACERRPVEGELLRHGTVDLVGKVFGAVLAEELRAELRDALVVDACLQVGVRVARNRRGRRRLVAVANDAERGATLALLGDPVV